jgi:pimeloyl-ACP methyl ester carboxylesterase
MADPVLLLHGQPGSARDWDRVRLAIGDRARTIALERPGWNGQTAPVGIAGNAWIAAAELDRMGIARATVVGHSFGGAVAALLAALFPARVGALVLVAPSANHASLNRLDRVLAVPLVGDALVGGAFAGAGAALATGAIRRHVAGWLAVEEGYLGAAARELVKPATRRAFMVEQRMLLEELPALEARLGEISAPTKILIGTDDIVVSPDSARQLATQIRGAEVVEIPGGNHLLPQLRPTRVSEVVLEAVCSGGGG